MNDLGSAQEMSSQSSPPLDIGTSAAFIDRTLHGARRPGLEHFLDDTRRSRTGNRRVHFEARMNRPSAEARSHWQMLPRLEVVAPGVLRIAHTLGDGTDGPTLRP
jgi:hypothetical protein